MTRRVPFFHRTVDARRARRPGRGFDTHELVELRDQTFAELWADVVLAELEVEQCDVHGIWFGRGEACPGCGALTPAKEARR